MSLDSRITKTDKETYLSWENGSFRERLKVFLPLCAAILFRPAFFFKMIASLSHVDLKRRLWRALIFVFILGYVKLFLDYVNVIWFKYLAKNLLEEGQQMQLDFLASTMIQSPFFIWRPLINFILVFLVLAVSIKFVLGFDKKLSSLFLVMCYKSASELFYFLPIIGGFVSISWSLFILIAGLREFYRADTVRLVFAGVIMPFLVSIFIIMASGPAINGFIVSVYPETKSQMVKLNEVNAFIATRDIVDAIARYKLELGFYPVRLGVLDKFLGQGAAKELSGEAGGYIYQYEKINESHFTLFARPSGKDVTGRFIFYSDESGKIYLGDRNGRQIQSAKEL